MKAANGGTTTIKESGGSESRKVSDRTFHAIIRKEYEDGSVDYWQGYKTFIK